MSSEPNIKNKWPGNRNDSLRKNHARGGSGAAATLYCSFCNKSQHEVRKLVAGPTVFICDECILLCDDILWESVEGRIVFRVKLPNELQFDDVLYQSVADLINEKLNKLDLKYECRSEESGYFPSKSKHNMAVYSFSRDAAGNSELKALKADVADKIRKLSISNSKFLMESKKRSRVEKQLAELKAEYLDFIRNRFRENFPDEDTHLRVVMFVDVSGFSKFAREEKRRVVDTLRGLAFPLLGPSGAEQINMWGDAIVTNFEDVNIAIECAVKFVRHLAIEKLDVRIGMAWGEVRLAYNDAIGRKDIDGEVVDKAARLEEMAEVGQILLSEEFGGFDITTSIAEIIPVTVATKKAFADVEAGEELDLYCLRVTAN